MPRKKQVSESTQRSGGRKRLPVREARSIKSRLADFVREHHPSRLAFENAIGLAHATVTGWFSNPPRTPETPHLVTLAKKANINLNYLLLGEGTVLRENGVQANDLAEQLRARVVAELRSVENAPVDQIEVTVPPPADVLRQVIEDYRERLQANRETVRQFRPLRSVRWMIGKSPPRSS